MKKQSWLALILAILLTAIPLVSCGGDLPQEDASTSSTSGDHSSHTSSEHDSNQDPDPEVDRIGQNVDRLTLAENGKTAYRLIYPLGAGGWKKDLVMWFCDTFYQVTGAELELCDDFEAEDEPRTLRTAKEIVIGSGTTREDLYTVDSATYQKGYSMFVDRERFVIAADYQIGLWLAMRTFFADVLGVDVEAEELTGGIRSCTVSSDYESTRLIRNAALFALGDNVSSDFCIVVDPKDDMQVRMSYGLQSAIQSATGENFTITADPDEAKEECILLVTDPTLQNGDWKLTVRDSIITISAGDYYGYTGASAYLSHMTYHGTYAQFTHGFVLRENYRSTLTELTKSTGYAFTPAGDVRVMFHNVLFYDPLPAERNRLQAEMFKIYMPDVLGLQEFNSTKRGGAGKYDLCKLLGELGYVETIDPNVRNAYRTSEVIPGANRKGYGTGGASTVKVDGVSIKTYFNHTPLFYNTNTTKYIDGGYYWYKHQVDAENLGNCSAGDCASKSLTWGVFEDIATGGQYIVISTHMCTRSSGVRQQQGYEVLELIEEILKTYDLPIFLGGDMNSSLSEDNCKIFTEGGLLNLCADDLATEYTAKLNTSHAYPIEYEDAILGKKTVARAGTAGMSGSGGIDHIFVDNLKELEIRVYGAVIDLYAEMGSDHVPLFCDFSFPKTE